MIDAIVSKLEGIKKKYEANIAGERAVAVIVIETQPVFVVTFEIDKAGLDLVDDLKYAILDHVFPDEVSVSPEDEFRIIVKALEFVFPDIEPVDIPVYRF